MVYQNGRLYYTSNLPKDSDFRLGVFSVKPDGSDRKEERTIAVMHYNSTGYSAELYKHYAIMEYDLNDSD